MNLNSQMHEETYRKLELGWIELDQLRYCIETKNEHSVIDVSLSEKTPFFVDQLFETIDCPTGRLTDQLSDRCQCCRCLTSCVTEYENVSSVCL